GRKGRSKVTGLLGGVEVQSGGRAYPVHVLVVINSHHQAAAHADDGEHRLQIFQPDVHDAYFSFRSAVRSLDHGFEVHALLQDVIRAFLGWDGVNILSVGCDYDPEAGERVQRFERVVLEIGGNFGQFMEKPYLRNRAVPQVRNGKFADAEIPVGMSCPFYVEIVAPIEVERHIFALQFVDNGPVVNPVNGDALSPAQVVEMRTFFLDVHDINEGNAQQCLC